MKVILLTIKYRTGIGSTITNIGVLMLTHKNLKIFHALGSQNTISLTPSLLQSCCFGMDVKNVSNLLLETVIKMQEYRKPHEIRF